MYIKVIFNERNENGNIGKDNGFKDSRTQG